ncbi:MAG: succinyl-diaminopimelate desuccinylase [Holosporales bacterium]|jgi:succinyl-diaminopimelate desuccinylase|nr:succinyl-diaminopimelate desuccinylase [Holosporales bacterium]
MDDEYIKILADLVSFESITPQGDDAIDYCSDFLFRLGFVCKKLKFNETSNLYAKLGNNDRNFCFAGHVDVVPPFDNWATDPFVLTEKDGILYGRGVNDMKGPLVACLAAIRDFITSEVPKFSISVLLTSDEEIMGNDGTSKVVKYLKDQRENISGCVLCESCSVGEAGEYIKIGCRGSMTVDFTSTGEQRHVVAGQSVGNHINSFATFLHEFVNRKLDNGNGKFPPTAVELTSIDVGNDVRNIIPSLATAKASIRFCDSWTGDTLEQYIRRLVPKGIAAEFTKFTNPLIGATHGFAKFLESAITDAIGIRPEIGTHGGNSDATSISTITEVAEIGSPVAGAHIVNESLRKDDFEKLRVIYLQILKNFTND